MRSCVALLFTACIGCISPLALHAGQPVSFERDIRPIFKAHCFQCHGEDEHREGNLDLRLARFALKGGDSGPVVVPAKREDSYLYDRVQSGEMPPGEGQRLSAAQVELIGRWIDAGAPTRHPEPEDIAGFHITAEERDHWAWQPIMRPAVPLVKHADLVRTPIDAFLLAKLEAAEFSFSPDAGPWTLLRRACLDLLGLPPTHEQVARFVAVAEAASFGSQSAPDASSVRGTGRNIDAWERLIDELLASPHYGERWGRHWLDVAGYADSEGYTIDDHERAWAWKFRDYVVRAFNADKPFDAFIREQLAGDEQLASPLDNLTPEDAEKLVATGFLRMAPDGTLGRVDDADLARNEVVAETIKIVSSALLGVTLGCAQCHDHRYDPLPQTDYYRFRAIFEPALDWKNWRNPKQRLVSLYTDADRAAAAGIEAEAKTIDAERETRQKEFIDATFEKEVDKLPEDLRAAARHAFETAEKERTPEQKTLFKQHPSLNVNAGSLYLYDQKAADELKALADKAGAVRAGKPSEEFVHALTEIPGQAPPTHLFYRGNFDQPKQELSPGDLTVVSLTTGAAEIPVDDAALPTTGRRTALARHLTSGNHPLVARVIVNRVWLHHFGRGLVATPADFGVLGARPTHPELLDWLASQFVTSGWSVKHLHRLIMRSTAYRQALRVDPAQDAADPDNLLYGGSRLKRLDAEVLRDSVLAVSGALNDKAYGPPVPVMADTVGRWVIGKENLNAGRPGEVIPMHGEDHRRSVYVQVRRTRPLAVLDTFDWPRMEPNCDLRRPSTSPPQSLLLMNNDFVLDHSRRFAERVRSEAGTDRRAQVSLAWTLAYAREPEESEVQSALTFLDDQAAIFAARPAGKVKQKDPQPAPEDAALASLCQMLLGSNEFLYVD
jgi:hypothetical protein